MSRPGIVVFILFFGIALLDAIRGGHWLRVAFWVAMGSLFWMLDRRASTRPDAGRTSEGPGRRGA